MLVAACLAAGGCGGKSQPPPLLGTPAGDYALTVTATSGGLSHAQTVELVVQ